MVGKRLTGTQRRQQIVDTAIQLFAENGFRGTTTRSIAEAAGVSEATLFLHFAGKDELYQAILEEAIQSQERMLEELESGTDYPLDEALHRIATATLNRGPRQKMIMRLLFYSALEEHTLAKKFFRQQMSGPFQQLLGLLEKHVPTSEGTRADSRVAAGAFAAMMMWEILTSEFFGVGRLLKNAKGNMVTEYVDMYLNGVGTSKKRR